jgi:hypothetical protein
MVMQQQGKEESGPRTSLNVLYFFASGWAWCLLPFLRCNLGTNAIGVRGIVAFIVMWAYAALAPCPELVPFFGVWLVVVIIQRLRTAQLVRRGVVMHSRYAGDPLVMKFLPFIGVGTAKLLEVMICFAAGLVLGAYWPPLGGFVLIGAVAMVIMFSIDDQIIRNRQQAMRDAELEQRFYADLHRGRRDDY